MKKMIRLAMLMAVMTSCGYSYIPCNPSQYGKFRCGGDGVEICDGEGWSPRWTCEHECEMDGDIAVCQPPNVK